MTLEDNIQHTRLRILQRAKDRKIGAIALTWQT